MKKNKKVATYMDKLMEDKSFQAAFEEEYANLLISEEIVKLRKSAHMTQGDLAKIIHTTKSAISRYESARYRGYSIPLLEKIARACGADLLVKFKKNNRVHAVR